MHRIYKFVYVYVCECKGVFGCLQYNQLMAK